MYKFFINGIFVLMLVLSVVWGSSAQDFAAARRNLMPVPANVAWKNGRLPVTKNFSAAVAGKTDERLKQYVSRVMRRLEGRTVLDVMGRAEGDVLVPGNVRTGRSSAN